METVKLTDEEQQPQVEENVNSKEDEIVNPEEDEMANPEEDEMANPEEDEIGSEEEYDPYKARTAEENQRTHCDRLGCCYCLLSIAVLYILMIGVGCYFMYLGRFSLYRGFAKVKRTYNSMTWSNLGRVVVGNEIIYVD